MKKYIGILCVVLVVGSYFLYQYRTKQILEKANAPKDEEVANDYSNSPFNGELREMIFDFWKTTGQDSIKSKKTNDISILGENVIIPEKEINIIRFIKAEGVPALKISTARYYDKNKAKSYTYLDEILVVYYGEEDGITQNLVDTARMSDGFELISGKYASEGKPVVADYEPIEKIYKLK